MRAFKSAYSSFSRDDLLRVLADEPPAPPPHKEGFLPSALAGLDEPFIHHPHDGPAKTGAPSPEPSGEGLKAADFRTLAADFERKEIHHHEDARREAEEQRRRHVAQLIDKHISDENWRAILHQAHRAAENGEEEFLSLRFPSQLCSDGGRAINVTEPDWPATLRGDAAEIYLRWERDLKPRGFHLVARVLDFPDGIPGDIGLFLTWRG